MAEIVYLLCAVTSLICSLLLIRSYLSSRTLLTFCAGACFFGLAINNSLLFVDLVVIPTTTDLSVMRSTIALLALTTLIYGCVWEAR
jgi:hypothetical protein